MKQKLLLFAIAVLAMTSCAGLTHVTAPESNVNFVGQETETVRKVSYTLEKTYVFGIGGLSKKARNTNIMDELMKRASLGPNEALAYITISENANYYCGVNIFSIVTKIKFTATGYVVRPKQDASLTD